MNQKTIRLASAAIVMAGGLVLGNPNKAFAVEWRDCDCGEWQEAYSEAHNECLDPGPPYDCPMVTSCQATRPDEMWPWVIHYWFYCYDPSPQQCYPQEPCG